MVPIDLERAVLLHSDLSRENVTSGDKISGRNFRAKAAAIIRKELLPRINPKIFETRRNRGSGGKKLFFTSANQTKFYGYRIGLFAIVIGAKKR
jgi:hypothetical protein